MASPARAWAVVPAGGSGSRFSACETQDKLLALLAGTPVLTRTIASLLATRGIEGVVIAASEKQQPHYRTLLEAAFPKANIRWAPGGLTRRESVYNGLLDVPESAKVIAVHDAARPLIRPLVIESAIQTVAEGAAGAVVSLPMYDTVKQVAPGGPIIETTLDRETMWRAQTPQVFRRELLLEAHQRISPETAVTDDAQLLELAGIGPVMVVPGEASNLKITTREDLRMAEAWCAMLGL